MRRTLMTLVATTALLSAAALPKLSKQDQAIRRSPQQAATRTRAYLPNAVHRDSKSRRMHMAIKTVFAFVSALAATSSAALAQHVDPSPYSAHLTSQSA